MDNNASHRLRSLLKSERIATAAGAHSVLSARLAEEAGFDLLWASGLEISALNGVPDADILSMSDYLAVAAAMARGTSLPVLADCDSGFGNSNNVAHMVREYEAQGVAGVCIEDKLFPKMNSFVPGQQDLATVEEFVARLVAAKSAQRSKDFVVVARIEALIAGAGLDEALHRARAYERAGADALLIHSKATTPEEVFDFRAVYDGALPVVAVPTTYSSVTAKDLEERGFALAIYANQGVRSAVQAMRSTFTRIVSEGTTAWLEDDLVPVRDVFALQRLDEMLKRQGEHERLATVLVAELPARAPGDYVDKRD